MTNNAQTLRMCHTATEHAAQSITAEELEQLDEVWSKLTAKGISTAA